MLYPDSGIYLFIFSLIVCRYAILQRRKNEKSQIEIRKRDTELVIYHNEKNVRLSLLQI